MRILRILLIGLFSAALIVNAAAVPLGKKMEYEGGGSGKVIFDGKIHADKGLKCNDCHTKIFQMRKGAKITMSDMNAGKYCGECHNGTKAFASKDPANCAKCHKK